MLFSEAIAQPKVMAGQQTLSRPATIPAEPRTLDATDCILQEITAVGRCLEAMDLKITELSAASASIKTDIACFIEKVADLNQHLTSVEDHMGMLPEHVAELQTLREKINDLENRSHRDNVRFFGIPEKKEGTDIKAFLQSLLPELTGLTCSSSRGYTGSALLALYPRGGPTRSLHVSSGTSRPSRSS
ncbi:hypothetical protein NDU88_005786 [Pleurodeles waltl]|uniref:Uncharacterized protein n=1 Tax=Pleurodeles waltl TaxID=8319 RepID=A0AAV7WYP5_PLEWA|nr:hypothetical protein NDU88_005786 [Pleurodeles waltl]